MADNNDTDLTTTIDNNTGELVPTPTKKIDLATINDVRLEMATVYRGMRGGSIETSDGTRLIYTLGAIGKMIEAHDIEKRIEDLENNTTNKQRPRH